MFTGLVEAVGELVERKPTSGGCRLRIATALASELAAGDSIAVNGVCLTVILAEGQEFHADVGPETVRVTTLGRLSRGRHVNLERPLRADSRFGGHFVQGHVDGAGKLDSKIPGGEGCVMSFCFPRELARYLVTKGSIAVDGISLTIASLEEENFAVAVIPHTLEVTNLKTLNPGDDVNLEVDILGKYFERFFQLGLIGQQHAGLTFEYLKNQGF